MTNYINYPCGCSASEGCPTYCPTHMPFMPLIREYAQFMYEAGYANDRPNGDHSVEAAEFEKRIAAAHGAAQDRLMVLPKEFDKNPDGIIDGQHSARMNRHTGEWE